MLGRLFDALEQDFLQAYPESKPIFERGAEKEMEKLFHLRIYPKRGPQGIVDLVDEEYDRLLLEMVMENNNKSLHLVDINNSLAELDTMANMF